MILTILSLLCIAIALIIYTVRHVRKALEDKRYNEQAEIEEAMSMYENGLESG